MLKLDVLIIEDESSMHAQIETKLGNEEYRFRTTDFIEFDELEDINPDIVILDLMQGLPADGEYPGKQLHDSIWEKQLFPTIIFSANLEGASVTKQDHYFFKYVQKGKTGLDELASCVSGCAREIKLIKEVKKYVSKECANVLKFTTPEVISDKDLDHEEKNEILKRITRRRLAAIMDLPIKDEKKIMPWEQYVYPPIGSDIKMGDVLKKTEEGVDKFVLVLTPSCDLVTSEVPLRKTKVDKLLVAECKIVDKRFLAQYSIAINPKKIESELLKGNNEGTRKFIPLPAIKSCGFENMVACMKKVELIPINEVIGEQKKYKRILSVDSPFRESIAWAYMQDACRPGIPERDLERWSDEIANECL